MCHRYNIQITPAQMVEIFAAVRSTFAEELENDLYPLSVGPVVRLDPDGERELVPMQWGLLPSWWKPSGRSKSRQSFQRKCFNARSETVHEKPSYRSAFKKRRCLVPVHKFEEKGHWFTREDQQPMAFAGLWESWTDGKETVESYTFLTTEPNPAVQSVGHHRMPVLLDNEEDYRRWLSSDLTEREPLVELLRPYSQPLSCVKI